MRYARAVSRLTNAIVILAALVLAACGADEAAKTASPTGNASAFASIPATPGAPANPGLVANLPGGIAIATPGIAGPPGWYRDIPVYPVWQKLELNEAELNGLELSRSQYYIEAGFSADPVTTIVDFYTKKLEAAGWRSVQKLALSQNAEAGQQITFNRAQKQGSPQVYTALVSNSETAKNLPTTRQIAPKIPAGQNLVVLIASADQTPPAPVTPPVTSLPAGIAAENLSFDFGDGWTAQGQLTYPAGQSGPFPTVILVGWSGPNDMDETVPEELAGVPGGSKVFRQIAYALPLRGFAVLRYNRRGVIGLGPQLSNDPKIINNVNHQRLTLDAGVVLKESLKNPKVDPQRVIMLGHSEGSLNVSNLVAGPEGQQIAGVILMGVQGYDIKTILQYQLVDRAVQQMQSCDNNKDGKLNVDEFLPCPQPYSPVPKETIPNFVEPDKSNPLQQKFKGNLDKNGDNLLDIEQELRPVLQQQMDAFPNIPGFGPSGPTLLVDWQKYGSVTRALPAYKKPVLLLNGEADIQTVVQGAREAGAALQKARHPDHKLITYPGLGHTFYPVKGFSQPLGPIQEQVLKDMGDWLSQRYGGR